MSGVKSLCKLAREPLATFTIAALGCLIYGLMFLKNHSTMEFLNSPILIRFPLFLVAALFSHTISKNIEGPEKSVKEDFTAPPTDL